MPEETEIDPPLVADEPPPETPQQGQGDASSPVNAPSFGRDAFKLLSDQGSSPIDAMEIDGIGCLVRSYSNVVFVPGVRIKDVADELGNVIGRKLIAR